MADPPDQEPTTSAPVTEARRTWTTGRIAAIVAVVGMILFWMWILSGAPAKKNPDWIDDRAYAAALEKRCTTLRKDLDTLPPPEQTPTATSRAAVIAKANTMVADFIDRIDEGAPTTGRSATGLRGWITDWRTYLRDRQDYAARLRTDPKARLFIDKSPLGRPVDETIEIYAQVNHIDDCATPGDVG